MKTLEEKEAKVKVLEITEDEFDKECRESFSRLLTFVQEHFPEHFNDVVEPISDILAVYAADISVRLFHGTTEEDKGEDDK